MTRKQLRTLMNENKPFRNLIKVIKHYYKELIPQMQKVKDNRHSSYIVYGIAEILFPMLLVHVMTIGNMRGMTS